MLHCVRLVPACSSGPGLSTPPSDLRRLSAQPLPRTPLDTRAELREATQEEASKALHDFSWIDLTEPDPKYNGAAMRNQRLAPIWKDEQGNEMAGLFGRGCLTNATLRESTNCGLTGSRCASSCKDNTCLECDAACLWLRPFISPRLQGMSRSQMWSIRS